MARFRNSNRLAAEAMAATGQRHLRKTPRAPAQAVPWPLRDTPFTRPGLG